MLDELKEALQEKLIKFQYDAKVCEYIANKCDGTKTGARELRNIIRREIEDRVVDLIIESSEGAIGIVKATVKKDGSKIEILAK